MLKKQPYFTVFIFSVICFSVVVLYFLLKEDDIIASHLADGVKSNRVPDTSFNYIESEKLSSNALTQQENIDIQFNDLQFLPNNKLIHAVKVFWRRCQMNGRCEDALAALKEVVDVERYSIVKEYPEKTRRFNEITQYEINSQDQPLEQKIEIIKSAYDSVWGSLSESLFFDELRFYDQNVRLNSLYLDNQDLGLDEKFQVLDDWIKNQQAGDHDGLTSYDAANIFFSRDLELQSDDTLASKIADTYLNKEQATYEKQRLYRRQLQSDEAQSYQDALLDVRQMLMIEREGVYRDLDEADWMKYQEQKLRDFKIQFFKEPHK